MERASEETQEIDDAALGGIGGPWDVDSPKKPEDGPAGESGGGLKIRGLKLGKTPI